MNENRNARRANRGKAIDGLLLLVAVYGLGTGAIGLLVGAFVGLHLQTAAILHIAVGAVAFALIGNARWNKP